MGRNGKGKQLNKEREGNERTKRKWTKQLMIRGGGKNINSSCHWFPTTNKIFFFFFSDR